LLVLKFKQKLLRVDRQQSFPNKNCVEIALSDKDTGKQQAKSRRMSPEHDKALHGRFSMEKKMCFVVIIQTRMQGKVYGEKTVGKVAIAYLASMPAEIRWTYLGPHLDSSDGIVLIGRVEMRAVGQDHFCELDKAAANRALLH